MSTAQNIERTAFITQGVNSFLNSAGANVTREKIAEVTAALGDAFDSMNKPAEVVAEKPVPAIAVKKSVNPDFIVCLEDGKKLKMLKRHLRTTYNLSPEEYREKWGLPADYPMVAPNYAAQRSSLAKEHGLGRKPAAAAPAAQPADAKPRHRRKSADKAA